MKKGYQIPTDRLESALATLADSSPGTNGGHLPDSAVRELVLTLPLVSNRSGGGVKVPYG